MQFKPAHPEITLRSIEPQDMPSLLAMYGSTRKQEMDQLPEWTSAMKLAFITSQFEAQHNHYQKNYIGADFWVICQNNVAIGRLYFHENFQGRGMRIIDITLLPPYRNRGIGSGIINDLIKLADQRERGLSIHVESFNPAKDLYTRLGFKKISETNGVYHLMEWKNTI
ncbi:ribosomal protein S18 acetylase RimI-like enzyme [Dyadobacter jejuensis]|uniref:Ribosomal protein S18 acetylase RimI-like enzyme n=1 Tax=Dyadobacter jejuensis TaxID=1082580 RepID=A0A316ALY3_9BACT|nr:GNAT family N-acetyltransferase [Dyadobacter jejuensis]PWJ58074.1 ribosomal protein S18 acetylase RimI-like enzyme [Dyadobacter jejuensis]